MARRYDNDVKDRVVAAVRAAVEAGQETAVKLVAQEYEIPYHTVYFWAKNAGVIGSHITEQKKVELDALLEDKARMLLDSLTDDDKKMRDKAIAIGILLDKKIGLQAVLQGQGIGAADWLAHVTISRAGKDSVDSGRPAEGESMAPPDAVVPVSTTVGESNLPGSSS